MTFVKADSEQYQKYLSEIEIILEKNRTNPVLSPAELSKLREQREMLQEKIDLLLKDSIESFSHVGETTISNCHEEDDSALNFSEYCSNKKEKVPLQMGINLTAPQAESPSIGNAVAFANIFRVARPFNSLSGKLVENQNGAPCFNDTSQVAKTNLLESAQKNSLPGGYYPIHIKGNVSIMIKGHDVIDCPNSKSMDSSYQRKCIKLDFSERFPAQGLEVSVTPNSVPTCLEDLKIILPDSQERKYEDEILAGKISFNQDYLDYLKPFGVIRMMNFMYASPRLPEACRKIQLNDIERNSKKFNWNTFSPEAKECINAQEYQRTSQNRAKTSDLTYGVSHNTDKRLWKGVPIEVSVALAEQTGANPWINIPHNSSPEYIREVAKQFARLKKNHPEMKFHIEYSNEVWNGRFWGAKYMAANAKDPFPEVQMSELIAQSNQVRSEFQSRKAAVKDDPVKMNELGREYSPKIKALAEKINAKRQAEVDLYVDKSLEVFDIFKSEVGEESLVRTLGTNQKNPNATASMLKSLQKKGRLDSVDAIATATYFHGCWGGGSEREGKKCKDYLKNNVGLFEAKTSEQILDTLADPLNPDGVYHVLDQVKKQKEILDQDEFKEHEIALVSYEGGQHLSLTNIPLDIIDKMSPEKKREIIKLFHEANASPKMEDLYKILYEGWVKLGGKTHVNFIMAQTPSQFGSFGLSDSLHNPETSPKFRSAKEYAEKFCGTNSGI